MMSTILVCVYQLECVLQGIPHLRRPLWSSTGTGGVTGISWVEVGEAARLSATHRNVLLLLTTEASGPKRQQCQD